MKKFITLEVPGDYDEDQIKEYLTESVEDLYGAMDLEVNNFDDRAQVDDVNITEIELTADTVQIEYEIEYSAHHGCRDASYSESDQRTISGTRVGNIFRFAEFVAPPERTTYEEF